MGAGVPAHPSGVKGNAMLTKAVLLFCVAVELDLLRLWIQLRALLDAM